MKPLIEGVEAKNCRYAVKNHRDLELRPNTGSLKMISHRRNKIVYVVIKKNLDITNNKRRKD